MTLSKLTTLADWLDHIERQHPKSIDMGLDRVRAVATVMGLKRPAKRVITVGGTNGKGSTVAFIESIARAAGWKVGAYTSPHLLAYNERVRLNGEDADDASLVAGFEAVEAARGDVALTYFEYGTLCALWLFQRAKLDLAVLEVGLGGRLDATNVVDPDVAVITTVDLDHQDYLGDDREAIGAEKAGIARAWKPLVLGDDMPPSSVLGHAYAIGASAVRAGCDYFFEPLDADTWRWREVGFSATLPRPHLAAPVQLRNAATAIAALRALPRPPSRQALAAGIANARLAGRLQRFERDGVEIVVDVAHNPQAAGELAAWLGQARRTPTWLDPEPSTPEPSLPPQAPGVTRAVYAALADKDAVGVVGALAGQVDAWYLAGLAEHGPRGTDVGALATRLADTAAASAPQFADVRQALAAARAEAHAGDRILVFGSFHTAADALAALAAE